MCDDVLILQELLVCVQIMLVFHRSIRAIPRLGSVKITIFMEEKTDTMGCERIPNDVL